jgi:hypothetical protein
VAKGVATIVTVVLIWVQVMAIVIEIQIATGALYVDGVNLAVAMISVTIMVKSPTFVL